MPQEVLSFLHSIFLCFVFHPTFDIYVEAQLNLNSLWKISRWKIRQFLIKDKTLSNKGDYALKGTLISTLNFLEFWFSPDVQYPRWSPAKFEFVPKSLTLKGKHYLIKETLYSDFFDFHPTNAQ